MILFYEKKNIVLNSWQPSPFVDWRYLIPKQLIIALFPIYLSRDNRNKLLTGYQPLLSSSIIKWKAICILKTLDEQMPILFHTGKLCIDGKYIHGIYYWFISYTNKIINKKKKKKFWKKLTWSFQLVSTKNKMQI